MLAPPPGELAPPPAENLGSAPGMNGSLHLEFLLMKNLKVDLRQ